MDRTTKLAAQLLVACPTPGINPAFVDGSSMATSGFLGR